MSSLLDLVVSGVRAIELTRYAQLSSSTIILFDHLITFDQEVELIWRSSWTVGKALFVINRYYTLFSVVYNNYGFFSPHITDSVSLNFFKWQGWTGLAAGMIAEIILQMRLYALYFLDKKVLAMMVAGFVTASALSATVMGSVLSNITAVAHPIPGITFCTPHGVPGSFYKFWIPMLAFESFLCGLALFRGFQAFHSEGSLFNSGRQLVNILIRDSIFYYLVMFATYLTNLLIWVAAPVTWLEIPIGFSIALSCVLSNRIILNVRKVNKDLELSKSPSRRPMTPQLDNDTSFFSPTDTLNEIEMAQLRGLRTAVSTNGHVVVV